jgi:glycopeptide antibiotics resistance protein
MKNLKNYILNLSFKTFYLFYVICMINVMFANSSKQLFKNGYHFFYSFFSTLLVYILGVIFMLRLVSQLKGPPRSPIYLLKFSFYIMILMLSSAPFLYLWGMRQVISHLKW